MGLPLGTYASQRVPMTDIWCSDGLPFGYYAGPTCQYEQIDGVAMGLPLVPTRPTCPYEQTDGVTMGSPWVPTLVNVSL